MEDKILTKEVGSPGSPAEVPDMRVQTSWILLAKLSEATPHGM